jgi:CBS domain containing-hemolysin-like protein
MLFTPNDSLHPQTIPSHTVGGFVLDQLGFIPKGGESFDFGNFRFSVVEIDGRRVARVKIQGVRSSESKVASPPEAMLQSAKGAKSAPQDS